jgi:oxaloacetate decarboxylase alpha subunit
VSQPAASSGGSGVYSVRVDGKTFTVEVAESGQLSNIVAAPVTAAAPAATGSGEAVKAVLAGNIFKVHVAVGSIVEHNQPLLVVEAMKMETTISAPKAGTITKVFVSTGDAVGVGDALVAIE